MTVLKIYLLENPEEANPLTLKEGEHIIGRGFLNCNDKRISRKHGVIRIEKDAVILKAVHVNPCFYKSVKSNSISLLPKDESVKLSDNDEFSMVADNFWFKVRVVKDVETDPRITINNLTSNECDNGSDIGKGFKIADTEKSVGDITPERLPSDFGNIVTEEITENLNNNATEDNKLAISEGNDINESKSSHEEVEKPNPIITNITQDEIIPNVGTVSNPDLNTEQKEKNTADSLTSCDEESKDTASKVDTDHNVITGSNNPGNDLDQNNPTPPLAGVTQPKKIFRDRCWYGQLCYRKNPKHRVDLSHPGDDDYDTDPEDDRSNCPFGNDCFRVNLQHRRQYKHFGKPHQKPGGGADGATPGTSTQKPNAKKRRKPKKQKVKKDSEDSGSDNSDDTNTDNLQRKKRKVTEKKLNLAESPLDEDDPFINDDSSEEFEVSGYDSDSTDWEDSQMVDEESQETRRLLKEAKKFNKKKK